MPTLSETEITRLRAIEAAADRVILAAWTDRWSRLHGHPTVEALQAAFNFPIDAEEKS